MGWVYSGMYGYVSLSNSLVIVANWMCQVWVYDSRVQSS
jgi:hypothetical protein